MSKSVSILELRRIEAAILKDVYDTVLELHGEQQAEEVIEQAVKKSAIAQGRSMRTLKSDGSAGNGDRNDDRNRDDNLDNMPDLEDFADLIPLWQADGALEIEKLHSSGDRLEFNVTRCRYSLMYREMGLEKIGHLLSCNRDAAFCIGYNPRMKLSRTQTIMQGAKFCDFRYSLKDGE